MFITTLWFLTLATPLTHGASDADVTLIKVKQVVIDRDSIAIVVSEAKTRITLIEDEHDPAHKGDQWNGMPVTRVQVISNDATFTIKRPLEAAEGEILHQAWQQTLKTAKELQEGKEVGRIGFYAPHIVIKGNMIASINGPGFLYPKGK